MKEKRRKIQKENEDVTDKHRKEEVFGVFERERERPSTPLVSRRKEYKREEIKVLFANTYIGFPSTPKILSW